MVTQLGTKPPDFNIQTIGNLAQITFYENAVKLEAIDENENWQADAFVLTVPNRPNLQSSIASNYASWIEKAKDQEILDAKKILEEKPVTYSDQLDTMEMVAELQFDICLLEMGVTQDDL